MPSMTRSRAPATGAAIEMDTGLREEPYIAGDALGQRIEQSRNCQEGILKLKKLVQNGAQFSALFWFESTRLSAS